MQVRLMQVPGVATALNTEYQDRMSAPASGSDPGKLTDPPAIAAAKSAVAAADALVAAKKAAIAAEPDAGKKAKLEAELPDLVAKAAKAAADRDALLATAVLLNPTQPSYAERNAYTGDKLPAPPNDAKNPANVNRLRLVAFPDFVTANFTGADAAAMIPLEAANLGIGLSSEHVSSVSVKIPSAESYALPIAAMSDLVLPVKARDELNPKILEKLIGYPVPDIGATPKIADAMPKAKTAAEEEEERSLYVTVPCEVFYARSIDVNVNYSSAGAARVTASVPVGGLPPATQPAGAAVGPTDSLQSLINNVQARVGQTQFVPGGSIQVVSGNSFGVGIRRTFDRPVAIGFRGFTVRVKLSDLNTFSTQGKIPKVIFTGATGMMPLNTLKALGL